MIDQKMSQEVMSRARGALLGQAIGDALGTTVEFEPAHSIKKRFPNGVRDLVGGGPFELLPGQITDDSELALSLARTLVAKRQLDDDTVAAAYSAWYRSGPFDVGSTTARAFRGEAEEWGHPGMAARMRARASRESQANGSLMRQSPLGVFAWRSDRDVLADLACRDSSLSHPHPACQESCVAFTHAIALAVRTGTGPGDVYEETIRLTQSRTIASDSRVLNALVNARHRPPADYYHQMGWVLIALQNAFFRLLHSQSVEEALVATVAEGGDTDTNACIAGALVGAVWGENGFPARWTSTLLACESPRPSAYSSRDLLELVEALLGVSTREAQADSCLPH